MTGHRLHAPGPASIRRGNRGYEPLSDARPAAPPPEAAAWAEPESWRRGPEWEVPAPGEVLVDPAGAELVEAARQFEQAPELLDFQVGGHPAAALRRATREAAVDIGRRFARRFGLWQGPDGPPRYLVVTGHQPVLAHPGILVKNLLVAALAGRLEAGLGLNLVVDYDTAAELSAPVPCRQDGRLGLRSVPLAAVGYGRPFCQTPPPPEEGWERFRRQVDELLASLGPDGEALRARFARFARLARAAPLAGARHLAEWVSALRHRWEAEALGEGACYLEVPMEELADTRPFRLFFAHIALQAETFAPLYNDILARYRQARRIRSRANPFPDLAVAGRRVELPFWLLTPGVRRRALHVQRDGAAVVLSTADGPVTRLPARSADELAEALEREGLAIRPRAAALTLFVRLFLADVFVHGVGGARYDRVTDALIARFFGVRPPRYAVASASLTLEMGSSSGPDDEVARLRRQLRDLRFNPQRFVPQALTSSGQPEELQRLALEKERLIVQIQQPGAPKRELTRRIEEVNARLYEALAPVRETIEARLRQALLADAERQASQYRAYPAFLYDPARLRRMAETALDAPRRPSDESR